MSVSLFSHPIPFSSLFPMCSRPPLLLSSACPGVLEKDCVSFEHSRLHVGQCLCEKVSVCLRERDVCLSACQHAQRKHQHGPVDQFHMSGTHQLSGEPSHHTIRQIPREPSAIGGWWGYRYRQTVDKTRMKWAQKSSLDKQESC